MKLNKSNTFFVVKANAKCDNVVKCSESSNMALVVFEFPFIISYFIISERYIKPEFISASFA